MNEKSNEQCLETIRTMANQELAQGTQTTNTAKLASHELRLIVEAVCSRERELPVEVQEPRKHSGGLAD
jgi:hypothetical protein